MPVITVGYAIASKMFATAVKTSVTDWKTGATGGRMCGTGWKTGGIGGASACRGSAREETGDGSQEWTESPGLATRA
ncbi:MAG TPA: hypothetical protein VF128_06210, partial [Gemmatimonadaceae bacterium]